MRKNIAILSILATSLMSYAATAQTEAAAPPEGAPPVLDSAPPAAVAPEAAPAPAPAAAPAGYPDEYALRPLTLAAGTVQIALPIVLNLSKNAVLKPVWVPLDVRFGATNELEIFLTHNKLGMQNAGGGGVCIGGKDRGCLKFYDNANIGAQYSLLKNAGVELSGLLAIELRQVLSDPLLLAIDVGVGFKYVAAPISVKLAPQIGIGANKRSANDNKEIISVPLQVAFQAAPQAAIFLDSGIVGNTDHFGDRYRVPVGIGASYLAMHGLDVGLEFYLPAAMAPSAVPSDAKGFNQRTLMLFAAWRNQ
jgi:hypothetical protein